MFPYHMYVSPFERLCTPPFVCRYDFVPPVKYNYLKEEEAEERFERRNKTLNYFSIMLSKKIKEQEGEEEEGGVEKGGAKGNSSKGKRKMAVDIGLVRMVLIYYTPMRV